VRRECIDDKLWVEMQWKNASLGDYRRNKRAIEIANRMLNNPAASLPVQMGEWKNTKAAYRFFNHDQNAHSAIQDGHWDHVSTLAAKYEATTTILHIQDKSILDFSHAKQTAGLGPIGNHYGKGINIQSILAVAYDTNQNEPSEVLGLSYQKAWIRTERSLRKKEKRSDRLKRTTEGDYWIESLQKIERQEGSALWVTIGDRENDNYKFFKYCKDEQWSFLIRANNDRVIITQDGKNIKLVDWARSLPAKAYKTLELRSRDKKPARVASLSISWGSIYVRPPKNGYSKNDYETIRLKLSCIQVWEENSDLEWLLVTNLEVENETSALEKIGWYESRWLIEEYHKCLKTGCSFEKSQLQSANGLLALLGFLGVIAARLLSTKLLAKAKPSEKAIVYYPQLHLELL